MRQACLWICVCLVCACSDDDADRAGTNAKPDATKASVDAGSNAPASRLRPELPRAPGALKSGLPAELRPPR